MPALDRNKLLTTVNPELADQWNTELNTHLSLTTVYANSGKKAHWNCPTCAYTWEAVIESRNRGNGCPNCAGKIANNTNSLTALHPHIAAEYHPTLNSKPVDSLTAISHHKAWWQCPTNPEHSWEASVQNRVRQGDGCPYCSGRYPTKENNLAVVYPDIAAEFDLEANAPLTPYDFTPGSNKAVHWKCKNGDSWKVSVNSRTRTKDTTGCPFCAGTKANDRTNLLNTHPDIAAQYHPKLNKMPITKIRYGSRTLRWWQCPKEAAHIWKASVSSRTRAGRGSKCPQCSPTPRTSNIEKSIKAKLSTVLDDIPESYNAFIPLSNGKRAAVDVYGTYYNKLVVVEYDSWWWHSGVARNQKYEVPCERDTRKTQELLDSGYLVIRIREHTSSNHLPFLELDNPNLHQISWQQSEGLDVLIERIRSCITA